MFTRIVSICFVALGFTVLAQAAVDYVPMKVIQTQPVIISRRATELGVSEGHVRVSVQVDERGKLTDHLVTAYTHPALAESAVNAVKRWDYEPAYLDGHARSATVDLSFDFESRGLVVVDLTTSSSVEIRNMRLRAGAYTYGACTMRQLDRIPTPTKVVQPAYPSDAVKRPVKVTVEFYIDEQGRVRLPAVSRETNQANEILAGAAVHAVSQWAFEPPMSNGFPVLVAARQDFNFQP